MKHAIFPLVVGLVLVGCTAEERRGVRDDAGEYVGATAYPDGALDKDAAGSPVLDGRPDYDPEEVAFKAAQEAASKGSIPGLVYYLLAGVGAIGLGYAKRKFLGELASKVIKK